MPYNLEVGLLQYLDLLVVNNQKKLDQKQLATWLLGFVEPLECVYDVGQL